MKNLAANKGMSTNLVTIDMDDSMERAFMLMEDRRIRHLPVVDEEGLVVGILSDRDVNRSRNPRRTGGFLGDLRVSEFMTTPAITVDENTSLADVAEGMIDEKVSSFLVTRDGAEVVGIITSEDLMRILRDLLRGKEEKPSGLRALPYTPIVREALRELNAAGI